MRDGGAAMGFFVRYFDAFQKIERGRLVREGQTGPFLGEALCCDISPWRSPPGADIQLRTRSYLADVVLRITTATAYAALAAALSPLTTRPQDDFDVDPGRNNY